MKGIATQAVLDVLVFPFSVLFWKKSSFKFSIERKRKTQSPEKR